MKKLIAATLLTLSTMSISGNVVAQEDSGYLHSNQAFSSFLADVTKNVHKNLTAEERRHLFEVRRELNEQLIKDGIIQNVHFRTNLDTVDEPVYHYINNLVMTLNNFEELEYKLSGYADNRGDAEYNLDLSQRRVQAIKNILVDLGVPEENIETLYFGSTQSEDQGEVEKYFYDRKVEMVINLPVNPMNQ